MKPYGSSHYKQTGSHWFRVRAFEHSDCPCCNGKFVKNPKNEDVSYLKNPKSRERHEAKQEINKNFGDRLFGPYWNDDYYDDWWVWDWEWSQSYVHDAEDKGQIEIIPEPDENSMCQIKARDEIRIGRNPLFLAFPKELLEKVSHKTRLYVQSEWEAQWKLSA